MFQNNSAVKLQITPSTSDQIHGSRSWSGIVLALVSESETFDLIGSRRGRLEIGLEPLDAQLLWTSLILESRIGE